MQILQGMKTVTILNIQIIKNLFRTSFQKIKKYICVTNMQSGKSDLFLSEFLVSILQCHQEEITVYGVIPNLLSFCLFQVNTISQSNTLDLYDTGQHILSP